MVLDGEDLKKLRRNITYHQPLEIIHMDTQVKGGQMGKMQRTKGATEERRVCKLYEFALGCEVDRNLAQYQKSDGRDLTGTQPWIVQCKKGKQPNPRQALKEAYDSIGNGYAYPVAHIHDDRKEPFVVVPESVWMMMVEITKDKLK